MCRVHQHRGIKRRDGARRSESSKDHWRKLMETKLYHQRRHHLHWPAGTNFHNMARQTDRLCISIVVSVIAIIEVIQRQMLGRLKKVTPQVPLTKSASLALDP
jgi:hypothetical protein